MKSYCATCNKNTATVRHTEVSSTGVVVVKICKVCRTVK